MIQEIKRVAPDPVLMAQVDKILEQNAVILAMNQLLLKTIVSPVLFVDKLPIDKKELE